DHLGNSRVGYGDRALGGGFDVLIAVAIDQIVEPEVERQHRRAGEEDAGGDRDECLVARPAQIRPRLDSEQPWRAGVNVPLSLSPPTCERKFAAPLPVTSKPKFASEGCREAGELRIRNISR